MTIERYSVAGKVMTSVRPRQAVREVREGKAVWIRAGVSIQFLPTDSERMCASNYDSCVVKGEWHTQQPIFTREGPFFEANGELIERPRLYANQVFC